MRHLFLLFVFISSQLSGQHIKSMCSNAYATNINTDSICEILVNELKDSTITRHFGVTINENIARLRESVEKPSLLYPYAAFDSVNHIRYSGTKTQRIRNIDTINISRNQLCLEKVNSLLTIINNPLNFMWGECGTPVIEDKLIFYHQGKSIAEILVACSGKQLIFSPPNHLSRHGSLKYHILKTIIAH